MNISSKNIPFANRLLTDYINGETAVDSFYSHAYKSDWQSVIDSRAGFNYPRKALSEVLELQNKALGAGETTLSNIKKLTDENTFAVVTGQQAGLLGGPLYTIYKTITVIKQAAQLQKAFPDYHFLPVFWMEVNDSDFEEIRKTWFYDKSNQINELAVAEDPAEAGRAVAGRKFGDAVPDLREVLEAGSYDTEFRPAVLDKYFKAYAPNVGIADSFGELLHGLFGEYGLVTLNPAGPDICRLVNPLYRQAIERAADLNGILQSRSQALEAAGYGTQINIRDDQTLLFYIDSDYRRLRIDMDGNGGFRLKDGDGYRAIGKDKLLNVCADRTEFLSPNVALRPLMQDWLLPTVAYVGGPSEVAYMAQVQAVYQALDMPMPKILPRHRLTIIEAKYRKLIEKYNLDEEKLLTAGPDFVSETIQDISDPTLYDAVDAAEKRIKAALADLEEIVKTVDETLMNPLGKTRGNIENSFGKFQGRITGALEQQNKIAVQQLERLVTAMLPDGVPQERIINPVYFLIKYGPDFVDRLLAALPDDPLPHYLVDL